MTAAAASPDATPTRHLAPDALDHMWAGGVPLVIPVPGTPYCRIRLHPALGEIALDTEYSRPEPDLATLRNITFDGFVDDGVDLAEIAVQVSGSPRGAYALLTTIADELQLNCRLLAIAVNQGVEQHKDVLATRGGLSAEAEIGLYGELLFVEHLIAAVGAGGAVNAWQGPLSEEHDFVLESARIELKTTSSERRRHVIHGLKQLVPVPGADLYLISVQITRAAGESGRTLPTLVEEVRSVVGGYVAALDQRLNRVGWRADDAALYQTAWTLRTEPRAYEVGADFPALTPDRVRTDLGLIDDVSYRIDVTNVPRVTGPGPVSTFVEPIGSE